MKKLNLIIGLGCLVLATSSFAANITPLTCSVSAEPNQLSNCTLSNLASSSKPGTEYQCTITTANSQMALGALPYNIEVYTKTVTLNGKSVANYFTGIPSVSLLNGKNTTTFYTHDGQTGNTMTFLFLNAASSASTVSVSCTPSS